MIHNAIAHHLLTDAQPIPKQPVAPTPASHPILMMSDGMKYPFSQLGSAVLGLSPPSS